MINHPPFAPCIWIEAGQIHLYMPSTQGGLTSHSLTLKDSPEGWDRVRFLIANRSQQSLIGTKGDPTQHQIDKKAWPIDQAALHKIAIKAMEATHAKPTSAMRSAARDVMRRLGL